MQYGTYPWDSGLEQEVGERGGVGGGGAHGERDGVSAALHVEHDAETVLVQRLHRAQLCTNTKNMC